jgi:YHS domain-containing protein
MKKIAVIALIFLLSGISLFAQEATRKKHFNLNSKGLAIEGYDPVAYFTQNKAIEGKKEFISKADGVVYRFSSAANRDLFNKNYKAYEPQYGGWCAYAMGANGEKVEVDPETFKIVNGKLYLFYHSWTNNTLNKWNKDENNLKAKADYNWTGIFR